MGELEHYFNLIPPWAVDEFPYFTVTEGQRCFSRSKATVVLWSIAGHDTPAAINSFNLPDLTFTAYVFAKRPRNIATRP